MAWKLFFIFRQISSWIILLSRARIETKIDYEVLQSDFLSLIAITWREEEKSEENLMKQIMGSLRIPRFPFIDLRRKHSKK